GVYGAGSFLGERTNAMAGRPKVSNDFAYLDARRETLRRFHNRRILVAVAEASVREGATTKEGFIPHV
ncbi:MAG TPA: hypothetical protein VMK12_18090, partial [Anaeromyxobacteraceae bacterium]|nr:hypothetical protein [Anaeromyxobacteraceae bacterium]